MDTTQMKQLMATKGTVLVEFYATWCPHCKRMMPVVDDIKALYEGKLTVFRFDIDENDELATELDVKSIPTFIIYRDGEEQWRSSGEMPAETLSSKINQYL